MKLFVVFCMFFFVPAVAFPQSTSAASGIRGKVTDQNGAALPFAGVSIKGTTVGTLANSEGNYELALSPGQYSVHFHHLGFGTLARDLSVGTNFTTLNVSLEEQALTLRELQVGKEVEDPAYTIMRKAISKAGYHQLQIQSYSASAYARSTAVPTKIPVLMKKRLKKQGISEGVAFVNESVTKVDFKRPNSYTQRIISTRNNLDNSAPTPNEFIFASFYNPEVGGTITPLSPKALSVYKFKYEGHFEDRGEIINKIKVTPKSFKQGVFKGNIYIIEGRWAIHSFNLQTIWQGFTIQVKQLFSPLQNVWMPGSQHFDLNGSYLGFAGKFTYIVSIQYEQLRVDPALKESVTIVDTKRDPDIAAKIPTGKNLEQLLAEGQQADTKSFRKIVKKYEKEQRKSENPHLSTREVRRDSITVEPLANKRDSSYWTSVRGIPLTQTEIVSYQVSDSIIAARRASTKPPDTTRFKPVHLLTGAGYRYRQGRSLSFPSPVRSLNFNPAEAFNLDFSAEWRQRFDRGRSIRIQPLVHYSTGRNRLSPALSTRLESDVSRLTLEGGEEIVQFNPLNPIPPVLNSLYYLLFNRNHIRLYQKQFLNLSYRRKQIFDVFDLTAGIETGKRTTLPQLEKSGGLLWGDPHLSRNSNLPAHPEVTPAAIVSASRFTLLSLHLDIRPWQKFRVRNGRKRFFSSNEPTFSILYKKGIPLFNADTEYDFLEAGVRYDPKLFTASVLQMAVSGGKFLRHNAVFFQDYKHFMGNQTILQTGDRLSQFRMMPYYQHSTARSYIQAHVSLNSPKLLLTQLPLLRLVGLKEYLQAHFLHTTHTPYYSEQVYGLEGILKMLRAELVTHFDRERYKGIGVRIGTSFRF